MDLEAIIDRIPQTLGRENFEHRRFEHVILEAAIDQRRRHLGHRFHRIDVGRGAGDFFLYQVKIAQRFVELLALVRVLDRETKAGLGCAGAAGAKSRASEIKHSERDPEAFA